MREGGMKTTLAIDPGVSGGFAWTHNGREIHCMKMPETDGDVLATIRTVHRMAFPATEDPVCYMEEVGGFTGKATPGSAMFNFGDGNGFLRGVVMSLGFRLERVRPQKWQASLGIGNASSLLPEDFKLRTPEQQKVLRATAKQEWKRRLKAKAQELYPMQNVTLSTCDALLILYYARRQETNPGERVTVPTVKPKPEPQRPKELTLEL